MKSIASQLSGSIQHVQSSDTHPRTSEVPAGSASKHTLDELETLLGKVSVKDKVNTWLSTLNDQPQSSQTPRPIRDRKHKTTETTETTELDETSYPIKRAKLDNTENEK